jgi:hypothetical protein
MYTKITNCRICTDSSLTSIFNLGNQSLTGVFPKNKSEEVPAGPLELIKCDKCHLVQLAHNYDLSKLYGENYGYRSGLNRSMVRHLQSRVQQLLKHVDVTSQDLVLDIGANDSTLLQNYPKNGATLLGVDPSGPKFKKYYPEHISLIPDFFSAEIVRKHTGGRKAKVITSIAMFYDLDRPTQFMREIYETLADDGIWVFEQSYLPFMLDTCSYDTVCHEHLEYYSLHQIKHMADTVGFKIVDLEFNDVNGGSFAITVAKKGSKLPEVTALIEKTLAQENDRGLSTLKPYQEFARQAGIHRQKLKDFLASVKSGKKTILGYGASTKGNVLLQYCGLTIADIPVIAEVNEDKFGAYTPGTRIPIVSEAEARKMKPDYFLVLPWHFKKGIVEREQEYLRSGGKLVFPLPAIETVTG